MDWGRNPMRDVSSRSQSLHGSLGSRPPSKIATWGLETAQVLCTCVGPPPYKAAPASEDPCSGGSNAE